MLDQVIIAVQAGDGGRGAVSFRREKFVPYGGPDGGDGGRGGHVIVMANAQINTLNRYRQQRIFRARNGTPGSGAKKRGRNAEDLVLEVPVGTTITRADDVRADAAAADQASGEVLADLQRDGDGVVVARGGRGGRGNHYFKGPTNQAPRVAQVGQRGEGARIQLELRLIADVGVVGLPNAGKSTLLRALTAATPRVASYPFTTLEPHLGVVTVGWDEYVVADLPGLIEGAAEGAGLGHEFLRHTERTRLLVHLIDGASDDPLADYTLINGELAAYSDALAARPQVVAINKSDLPEVDARRDEIAAAFQAQGVAVRFLSAAAQTGTADSARALGERLQTLREAEPVTERTPIVVRPRPERRQFHVEREGPAYRVVGEQVETFIEMLDLEDEYALEEAHRWLTRRGVAAALKREGLTPGDRVRVRDQEWSWEWQL